MRSVHNSRLLSLLCVAASFVALTAPRVVSACSYPAPGWQVNSVPDTVPVEGVVVINAIYYTDFAPETAEESLKKSEVTLSDSNGNKITGSVEYDKALSRLIWRASAALQPATQYTLSVKLSDTQGVLKEWAGSTVTTRSTAFKAPSVPGWGELTLTDSTRTHRRSCCTSKVVDSCGGTEYCYITEYEYRPTLKFGFSSSHQTPDEPYFYFRLIRVKADGTEIPNPQPIWPKSGALEGAVVFDDVQTTYCAVIEVVSLVDQGKQLSEKRCVSHDKLTPGTRRTVHLPTVSEVCTDQPVDKKVGTMDNPDPTAVVPVDPDPDTDTTTPTPDSTTPQNDGGSTGTNTTTGGSCRVGSSTVPTPLPLLLVVLLSLVCIRRAQQKQKQNPASRPRGDCSGVGCSVGLDRATVR